MCIEIPYKRGPLCVCGEGGGGGGGGGLVVSGGSDGCLAVWSLY